MSQDSPQKWVDRLIPLAAIAFLFLLGESAARVAIWWQYGSANHANQEQLNYAPFLITAGDEATYAYRPRREGVPRVLWCGSSTAQQFTREELEAAFERLFGRKVEVLNLSQGGYNSSQELVQLSLYGMQLQPDLIVTLDGINDIIGVTKTGKPGIPYLNIAIEQALTNPTTFWVTRLLATSQLVNTARKIAERRREVAVGLDHALIDSTVALYRSNITKISLLARGIGARHVAVLQPYLYLRQGPPTAEQSVSKNWAYRKQFMPGAMKQLNGALESVQWPDNASYINGLTAFDESAGIICFRDEAHLEPEGRRILLQRIVHELARRGGNEATSGADPVFLPDVPR
ncbi:MAG: SGNH/GDSL hydrolase family protein [Acidobacteria bacterium]|nr:SGNH/GDSL hydrolase family protein [Acidobacteriota bacterium]